MELPEGFERLKNRMTPVGPSVYQYADILNSVYLDRLEIADLNYAFFLMKEMAEALRAYANDSFDATSLGDYDEKGQGRLARAALQKFKEWK